MSCQTQNMETKTNGHSNKRACKIRKRGCSSSSSSSLVRKYRFKRAILAGKRVAGSSTQVKTAAGKSPILAVSSARISPPDHHNSSVSARKLAAALWEINGIPDRDCLTDKQEMRNIGKAWKFKQDLPRDMSDRIFSPASEKMVRSGGDRICRTSVVSHKLQVIDYNQGGSEIETHSREKCRAGIKTRLKDVSNSLTTSKELVKVLTHVHDLDDHHTASARLISALKFELDRARSEINQLIKDHRSSNNEMECLIKCFAEEKSAWKRRERERIRDSLANFSQEIEAERKLRKQTERLNKKLGKELADSKILLSRAVKELESEKRAKDIMGQMCDELARGIGEDKAEVERLRRDAEKAREEVEKEREMMQIADVLREERVQMKLSEAKYQFEEKNAAVEKLKNELEAYLRSKAGRNDENGSPGFERIKQLLENEEESDDSELHSIELNMDSNNRSYKWSFVKPEVSGEKIQWESIGLECRDLENACERPEDSDALCLEIQTREETERDKSIKSLRDYIISSTKIASDTNFASPTRQWRQSLPLDEDSPLFHDDCSNLKRKGSRSAPRTSTSSRK